MSLDQKLIELAVNVERAFRGLPYDTEVVRWGVGSTDVSEETLQRLRVRRVVARYPRRDFEDVLYHYRAVSFDRPIQRLRGIILRVYESGDVVPVAVPFFKFFNLDEEEETKRERLLQLRLIEGAIKADGTLIVAWYDPDFRCWRFCTRGNFDIFDPWTKAVSRDPRRPINPHVRLFIEVAGDNVKRLSREEQLRGYTIMFELVVTKRELLEKYTRERPRFSVGSSLASRFHPEEASAYLITARTPAPEFRLLTYSEAHRLLPWWEPKVTVYNLSDLQEAVELVPKLGKEGLVLYFEGGLLVKAKTLTAVIADRLAYVKTPERVLAEAVVLSCSDDLKPFLPQKLRSLCEELERLWDSIAPVVESYERLIERLIRERGEERASKWLKSNGVGTDIQRFVRAREKWRAFILESLFKMKPERRRKWLDRVTSVVQRFSS